VSTLADSRWRILLASVLLLGVPIDAVPQTQTTSRKRGAKYVPDENDALLAALNVKRLSAVIGPAEGVRARFLAVPPIPISAEVDFWPTWIVDINTAASAGRCYSLFVDPINLKPTRLIQSDCTAK